MLTSRPSHSPKHSGPNSSPWLGRRGEGKSLCISVRERRHSRPQGMLLLNELRAFCYPHITPDIRILLFCLHKAECLPALALKQYLEYTGKIWTGTSKKKIAITNVRHIISTTIGSSNASVRLIIYCLLQGNLKNRRQINEWNI